MTRLIKYPRSSAPPTTSESGVLAAPLTATVHRWVWPSGASSLSAGVNTVAVFPYMTGLWIVTPYEHRKSGLWGTW